MDAFPDVMHLFTNKLARLSARDLPLRLSFLALSRFVSPACNLLVVFRVSDY